MLLFHSSRGLICLSSWVQTGSPVGSRPEKNSYFAASLIYMIDPRLSPQQVDLVGSDPAQVGDPRFGIGQLCALGEEIGFAVGRVLHVLAEVDEVGGANLHGVAPHPCLTEEWPLRGMRSFGPRSAVIGRDAESNQRAQPRPVVNGVAELHHPRRRQAVGAIEPGVPVRQAAARIPAGVGERIGGHLSQALDRQVQRVVADQYGLAGGCLAWNRSEPSCVVDLFLDHSV
jgi:hypothetical protein